MNEIQKHVQDALNIWADVTLEFDVKNQEAVIVPDEYSDDSLLNAALILQHVIMNKAWYNQKGLDMDTRMERAENFGKDIRTLIKDFTGKDMKELAK